MDTKIKEVKTSGAIAIFDEASLPAEVTERVREEGDLINIAELTPEQIKKAREIVTGFDLNNTAAILTFAAPPQRAAGAFLDELLKDIRVKDAGVAGDIAKQLAAGIDLMALESVKNQIMNPPWNNFLARFIRYCTGWTNYLKNFYVNQKSILNLVSSMELKAQNRVELLNADSGKLDRMANGSITQVNELAVWILAGEIILIGARSDYQKRREAVLKTRNVVDASSLRDMARQIAAFEKRMLETETAYVRAGNTTLPRIRMVQEAIRIEIQNITEEVLFHFQEFKEAIIFIASLNDLKNARESRRIMDANRRRLDTILNEGIGEASRLAKESQGDPLERVQALKTTIQNIKTGLENEARIEQESRVKRAEAHRILVEMKDTISDTLKGVNLGTAEIA